MGLCFSHSNGVTKQMKEEEHEPWQMSPTPVLFPFGPGGLGCPSALGAMSPAQVLIPTRALESIGNQIL